MSQARHGKWRWVAVVALLGIAAGAAQAVEPERSTEYGIDFVTVGAPGNAPYQQEPPGRTAADGRGAVGYGYRMSETEITVEQWLDFVRAYAPYSSTPGSTRLTGSFIFPEQIAPGVYSYDAAPGTEHWPTNATFMNSLRFANWMHNGQQSSPEAFESGAYDLASVPTGPNDVPAGPITREAGAKFWIPSLDEWMKAVYYDPDKDGPGQGGYWSQPGGSDAPLVPGAPDAGGQTNASLGLDGPVCTGQYPTSATPWGLLDASGGMSEWIQDPANDANPMWRFKKGSGVFSQSSSVVPFEDSIDTVDLSLAFSVDLIGLRLAASVPNPSVFVIMLFPLTYGAFRRER